MLERIPCKICNREIVKFQDEPHDGICRLCKPLGQEDRTSKALFFANLRSGRAFLPTSEDLDTFRRPMEWETPVVWTIEKNWFSKRYRSLPRLFDYSDRQSSGHISCRSNRGASFQLAFNEQLGVCVYSNHGDTNCYAYTSFNLSSQVDADRHLCETCPCCGIVQGVYFASRFHIYRNIAFDVARAMLLNETCKIDAKWIPGDDCRWVEPGLG